MCIVINSRPAGVEAYFLIMQGSKLFFFVGESVKDFQHSGDIIARSCGYLNIFFKMCYNRFIMSLFSKKEVCLGVDIGGGGIKLVELHKAKGRPQLWTYGIAEEKLDIHLLETKEKTPEELLYGEGFDFQKKKKVEEEIPVIDDPRVEKYAELLKTLLKEAKVTTRYASASLPVSYIFHTIINLPAMEEKEVEHIVRAEIKKMLPRPIEEMQIVHQLIPDRTIGEEKKHQPLRVLVTAAPKQLVAFYTSIFQKAGLILRELETEAFALERSLVGLDQATAMVVDMGAERTNFFIIDQGLPLTHRTITVGGNTFDRILQQSLGADIEEVQQLKQDLAHSQKKMPTDLFLSILDPVVKEIEYSFDLFLHQTGNEGKRPEKIILTGGSAVFPFILEEIKSKFPLKVFLGDPWARVVYQDGLKTLLDNIGPRMAVSIGMALRNIV